MFGDISLNLDKVTEFECGHDNNSSISVDVNHFYHITDTAIVIRFL